MSKEIIIKNYNMFQTYQRPEDMGKNMRILGDDFMQASDGFHTFDELYDHRIALWITLCKSISAMVKAAKMFNEKESEARGLNLPVWRSKKHSDGEPAFGGTWFVLGIGKDKGEQITYHLPIHKWDACDFAEELEQAPEWDEHTPADVLERLGKL